MKTIFEARVKLRERMKQREAFNRQGAELPDLQETERRMRTTVKRLTDVDHEIPECWHDPEFEKCAHTDVSKCPAACHRAALFHRCDISLDYRKLLAEASGPKYAVTLVLPQWRREVGDLATFSLSGAQQKLRSLLRKIEGYDPVLVGGFEVSLNTDLSKECFWQWHAHFIVTSVPEAELKRVLMPPPEELAPWVPRPLRVDKVLKLTRQLGYAMKGFPKARTAYVDEQRQQRRHRGHRLDAAHQREHELFMAALTTEQVLITVGIRRVKGKPTRIRRQNT